MTEVISKPAPLLGEHTEELLKSLLKLSPDQVKELREAGAIS
jgi:crotonobetainyl-CoA:carnitine CoA-transferase CaiB-like acyl-CoA transferase